MTDPLSRELFFLLASFSPFLFASAFKISALVLCSCRYILQSNERNKTWSRHEFTRIIKPCLVLGEQKEYWLMISAATPQQQQHQRQRKLRRDEDLERESLKLLLFYLLSAAVIVLCSVSAFFLLWFDYKTDKRINKNRFPNRRKRKKRKRSEWCVATHTRQNIFKKVNSTDKKKIWNGGSRRFFLKNPFLFFVVSFYLFFTITCFWLQVPFLFFSYCYCLCLCGRKYIGCHFGWISVPHKSVYFRFLWKPLNESLLEIRWRKTENGIVIVSEKMEVFLRIGFQQKKIG